MHSPATTKTLQQQQDVGNSRHASNRIFLLIKCQIRISIGKEIQGKPCLEDSEWSSTEVSDQLKSWFRSLFIVRKAGSRIVHAFDVEVLCKPAILKRNHS
jgi:hypothetical protein